MEKQYQFTTMSALNENFRNFKRHEKASVEKLDKYKENSDMRVKKIAEIVDECLDIIKTFVTKEEDLNLVYHELLSVLQTAKFFCNEDLPGHYEKPLDRETINDIKFIILMHFWKRFPSKEYADNLIISREKTGHQYYGTEMAAVEDVGNCETCNGARCDSCRERLSILAENSDHYISFSLNSPKSVFIATILYEIDSKRFHDEFNYDERKQFAKEMDHYCKMYTEEQLHSVKL